MDDIEKKCSICGRALPTREFYRHAAHTDGLRSECKECTGARSKRHYHEVVKIDEEVVQRRRKTSLEWYYAHKEESNTRIRMNHRKEREAAIAAYGGRCECCGETRYEFLALDHIDGGGGKQRRKIGGKMARWLVRMGLPENARIRVLCHNCNAAIGFYGYCPHQKERDANDEANRHDSDS